MNLTLTLALTTGETHVYTARSLSGFHRPLNGEASNLTLTLDRDPLTDEDWFEPPLGAGATVTLDGVDLMSGGLTRVVMDRTTVQAGIEG